MLTATKRACAPGRHAPTERPQAPDPGRQQLTDAEAVAALPDAGSLPEQLYTTEEALQDDRDDEATVYPATCLDARLTGPEGKSLEKHEKAQEAGAYMGTKGGSYHVYVSSHDIPVPDKFFDVAGAAQGSCGEFQLIDETGTTKWELVPSTFAPDHVRRSPQPAHLLRQGPGVRGSDAGEDEGVAADAADRRAAGKVPTVGRVTIRVALEHRTTYDFAEPVQVYPHTIRLRPAPHSRTPIPSYSLRIEPANHFINWQQDPFGNWLARVVFPEKTSRLEITVDLVADMTVINPFDFFVEDWAGTFPFDYPSQVAADLAPYLHPVDDAGEGSGPAPEVAAWLEERMPSLLTGPRDAAPGQGTPIVDFVVGLNREIRKSVDYTVRLEPGVQTPAQTLARGIGSCRDSAWLLVAALRQLGLAARFVSGYLVQLSADLSAVGDDSLNGPDEDFTDLHAWAEVYIPGAGWVGLDATSGLLCGEGHIPLSATPHPTSAAPISGATGPVEVHFDFSNTVTRLAEDPRVTRPVDDVAWARITDLGTAVDELLTKGDVRLTMGGEPTFVAAGGTKDPQWHTDADGHEKRALALALAKRLSGSGTLRHHGQGKWYPGEPLPRWQIGLLERTDGQPLWRDPELLDDPWGEGRLVSGSADAAGAARDLAVGVARRLGIDPEHLRAAVEDPLQRLTAEARRPVGPAPTPGDLAPDAPQAADEEARAAYLAAIDAAADTGANVDTPAAWVLPVFPALDGEGWGTTTWRTRRGFLALVPGDSPAGLRLPLDSIAWSEGPLVPERSPFAPRGALPQLDPDGLGQVGAHPATVLPIDEAPRTALAVEHRDGHLFIFLPPLEDLDDAVELIAAVEDAAAEIGQPVVLEGYPLPGDERVRTMSVTPDPGVIEVNVSPTSSWGELVEQTETLYEHARQIHLSTEKFDLDGSHTGTGGGNHLTLGGTTPADSPMLRRPDLLRSLVTYWQHHPALSYLFSGRFIGPTSQAPRVDEGRADTLYELEIAFAQLDHVIGMAHDESAITEPLDEEFRAKRDTRPWLADRLLRHLLTDITGNTHRSEFCIDKLFSPGTERGRLGLLEMRGFEMPPHPRMALLQALLVRTLVARFWTEPYRGPLVHWGTRLHDRYLLPAFVAADLRDVIEDLNRFLESAGAGRIDPAWFDSFLEFRFPRLGDTTIGGVQLELRSAIEPWHVLGEEVSQFGTARYVDSSVEKVQVRAVGLVEGRHVVTCNGVPVPMVPVAEQGWGGPVGAKGSTGAFVGGVRYRAWAPPSALHPTIGVHAPLVFDLVDRWTGRSLGGFTHHVTHPGGVSYDSFPVNAASAESRRAARFTVGGHTPGPVDVSALPDPMSSLGPAATDFPVTLDLRRFPGTDRPAGTQDEFAAPPPEALEAGMPPADGAPVIETSAEGGRLR